MHFPRSHKFNNTFNINTIDIRYRSMANVTFRAKNKTNYNSHVTTEVKKLSFE